MSGDAAGVSARPLDRVAIPTFWDGVTQAFDIRGQQPPCCVLDGEGANPYAVVLRNWLRYGARGRSVAAQHLQDISE